MDGISALAFDPDGTLLAVEPTVIVADLAELAEAVA
jgi:hypothetical protein